jgi:hypothetical protein
MVQRAAPAPRKGSSDQHIVPLRRGDRSRPVDLQTSVRPGTPWRQGTRFKLVGILLLAPTVLILSALILVALLGIFVVWLAVVATMAAALVISDLIGGLLPALGVLDRRPIPAGQ